MAWGRRSMPVHEAGHVQFLALMRRFVDDCMEGSHSCDLKPIKCQLSGRGRKTFADGSWCEMLAGLFSSPLSFQRKMSGG